MLTTAPPHRKISDEKQYRFLIILIAIVFGLFVSFVLVQVAEEQKLNKVDFNSIDKGKSIGRNAMFIYCIEHDVKLTIELTRLLEIEDSIQQSKNFSYE